MPDRISGGLVGPSFNFLENAKITILTQLLHNLNYKALISFNLVVENSWHASTKKFKLTLKTQLTAIDFEYTENVLKIQERQNSKETFWRKFDRKEPHVFAHSAS